MYYVQCTMCYVLCASRTHKKNGLFGPAASVAAGPKSPALRLASAWQAMCRPTAPTCRGEDPNLWILTDMAYGV